jgi:hypothetical protein
MSTAQAIKQSSECLTMKMEGLLLFETLVTAREHGVMSLKSNPQQRRTEALQSLMSLKSTVPHFRGTLFDVSTQG